MSALREQMQRETGAVETLELISPDSAAATVAPEIPPQAEAGAPPTGQRLFKSPFTAKTYDMAAPEGRAQFARQHGRFVARGWKLYRCEHGHADCTIFDDGPCSKEFGAKAAGQ